MRLSKVLFSLNTHVMTEMLIIVFIAIGSIALIERRIIKAKRYREQVQSVTSFDRGTWSERDLIP